MTPTRSAASGPVPPRSRSRLSRLPALVLLLAALAAPPAQAQITVWSATLTVDVDAYPGETGLRGCSELDNGNTQDDCSTALTDDDFVFNGITYRIIGLNTGFGEWVTLTLDKVAPTAALTLHLGTTQWSTSKAERRRGGSRWIWRRRGPSWTDGQQVSVKLTGPVSPVNLKVTPGNAKLDLSWRAPTETVTGYDVHYTASTSVANDAAAGADAASAWVAVDRSTAGATASQSIPSLINFTVYRVRVRARGSGGAGAWAFGRGTPTDKSVDATLSDLTVASGADDATFSGLTLAPDFAADTTSYTANVANARTHVKLTPTVADTGKATVKVGKTGNLMAVVSGSESEAIALEVGANAIEVEVTAEDGNTVKTYTVTVTRWTPAPTTLTLTTSGLDIPGNTFVSEGIGRVTVTARLDRPAGPGGVRVALAAGVASTATATEDYTLPAAFTIAEWGRSATRVVTIVDDKVDENHETLVLTTTVSGLTVRDTTLTIMDNDINDTASVRLSESAVTVMVRESGSYRVWLATQPTAEVTVTPTSDTPAKVTVSGPVTFTPGTWHAPQEITVRGVEAGKATVWHAISSADARYGGGRLSVGTVAVTVVGPAVTPPAAPIGLTVTPGDAKLDLAWTAPAGTVTGYDVHFTASTAVSDGAAVDLNPATGWVAVSRTGTTAAQEIARLTNGTVYRVRVRAKNGSDAGPWAFATGTPQAEDRTGPAAPTFDPAHGTRTTNAGTNITLTFGEAIRKDDANTGFTGHADLASILTLKAGSSSGADIGYVARIDSAATVITIDPTSDLPGGAVYAAISNGYYDENGNRGPAASATFTVDTSRRTPTRRDPEPPTALTLSAAPAPEEGGAEVTVTARLDAAAPVGGTTVRLSLSGTAAGTGEEADYTLSSATIAIAEGETEGTATIAVIDDAVADDGETIVIDAASDTPALRAETLTLTIADNDEPATMLTLAAAPNPVPEGSPVTVTARLSAALARTVTIPVTVTMDTSEAGDHGTLSSITIDADATSGTGTITTSQDDDTDDETFTVALGSLPATVTAGTPSSVQVTISDDDGRGGTTPSADASLRGLLISDGALVFDPARTSYAVAVAHEVASVMLTPTVNHAGATVAVNGAAVASGMPSGAIPLSVGQNRVAVVVTAEDGTTRTYRVTVTRGVKVLGAAEKEHVDKVGQALLGRDDPGVYPPEGASNR